MEFLPCLFVFIIAPGVGAYTRYTTPTEGMKITCTARYMQLDLDPGVHSLLSHPRMQIHLLNHPNCKPQITNSEKISTRIPLNTCGTRHKIARDGILYFNWLVVRERYQPGQIITRLPVLYFPVSCLNRKKLTRPATISKDLPLQIDLSRTSPTRLQASSGSPVTIECTFKGGSSPVHLSILKGNKPIAWERYQKNTNLTLSAMVMADESSFGEYSCVAVDSKNARVTHKMELNNTATSDKSDPPAELGRTGPDQYVIRQSDNATEANIQYILSGSEDIIRCAIPGSSASRVFWKKGGKLVRSTDRLVVLTDGSLKVRIAMKSDAGVYTCHSQQDVTFPKIKKLLERNLTVIVYAPLSLDEAKSSPGILQTFEDVNNRLMCTFQDGASPVTLTLIKGNRPVTQGVGVEAQTLSAVLSTKNAEAFGKYECVATDGRGAQLRHVMWLNKAGHLATNGIKTVCTSDHMDLRLNALAYPWIQENDLRLHLQEPNCTVDNFNKTQLNIRAPLYSCDTAHVQKNDHVTEFRNALIARVSLPHGVQSMITRVPDVVFPITCRYETTRGPNGSIVLQPIGPIDVDKLSSSPSIVYFLPGVAVTLTCAFSGGVLPLTITMTTNGQPVLRAQKTARRTLTAVVRAYREPGRFVCTAVDKEEKSVSQEITLVESEIDSMKLGHGVDLTCDPVQHSMQVSINRTAYPWLQLEHLNIHLRDRSCKSFLVNRTHIFLEIPLDGCHTYAKETSSAMTYVNTLSITEKISNEVVYPLLAHEIPLRCEYERQGILGLMPPMPIVPKKPL